jgi:hypothetical protein
MDIYTTFSFDSNREERVEKLLSQSHLTLQELIKLCLKKMAPKILKYSFQKGPLVYQPVTLSYKPMHFHMSDSEYEIYMDLKKISKCTLSLLIAIALDLYAEKISLNVSEERIINSYPKYKYHVHYFMNKNTPVYIFSWDETVAKEKPRYIQIE